MDFWEFSWGMYVVGRLVGGMNAHIARRPGGVGDGKQRTDLDEVDERLHGAVVIGDVGGVHFEERGRLLEERAERLVHVWRVYVGKKRLVSAATLPYEASHPKRLLRHHTTHQTTYNTHPSLLSQHSAPRPSTLVVRWISLNSSTTWRLKMRSCSMLAKISARNMCGRGGCIDSCWCRGWYGEIDQC